jgi:predicted PurR-regulated permease PerM
MSTSSDDPRGHVHPVVQRLAAYSWRLIVIAVVVLAVLWLLSRLRVVLIPVVVALFVTRALAPLAGWLRRHRWSPGLAAVTSMVAALVVVVGLGAAIVPPLTDEIDSIGPTVTSALDDVETWLAEDSPIAISRDSFENLRMQAGERFDDLVRSPNGTVVDRATLLAEVVTGIIVAGTLTFFMLRDGRAFVDWSTSSPPRRSATFCGAPLNVRGPHSVATYGAPPCSASSRRCSSGSRCSSAEEAWSCR